MKLKLNENKIESSEDAGLKEVVRRLRIQNKKLLEQVADLKVRLVQIKTERNDIQKQYSKWNNELSGAPGNPKTLKHEKDIFPFTIDLLCNHHFCNLQKN